MGEEQPGSAPDIQQRLWGLATSRLRCIPVARSTGWQPQALNSTCSERLPAGYEPTEALKRNPADGGRRYGFTPGYINEDCSLNHTDLTGIGFGAGDHLGADDQLIDLSPITRGLPQDLTWGTNSLLGPVFHVNDYSNLRVLGNVVYSQGRCRPGFVVKEFPGWKSIYSAAPNLPAPVLRVSPAGGHIYNDQGYAHAICSCSAPTAAGGERFSCRELWKLCMISSRRKRSPKGRMSSGEFCCPPPLAVVYGRCAGIAALRRKSNNKRAHSSRVVNQVAVEKRNGSNQDKECNCQ
jgi:hypothetical protein